MNSFIEKLRELSKDSEAYLIQSIEDKMLEAYPELLDSPAFKHRKSKDYVRIERPKGWPTE